MFVEVTALNIDKKRPVPVIINLMDVASVYATEQGTRLLFHDAGGYVVQESYSDIKKIVMNFQSIFCPHLIGDQNSNQRIVVPNETTVPDSSQPVRKPDKGMLQPGGRSGVRPKQ